MYSAVVKSLVNPVAFLLAVSSLQSFPNYSAKPAYECPVSSQKLGVRVGLEPVESSKIVTHPRQLMIEECRNFAPGTMRAYVHGVEHFSRSLPGSRLFVLQVIRPAPKPTSIPLGGTDGMPPPWTRNQPA